MPWACNLSSCVTNLTKQCNISFKINYNIKLWKLWKIHCIKYCYNFFWSCNYPWKCTMLPVIVNFFFSRHRSEAYSLRPCGRQELQRRWTPAGSRSRLRGLSTDSSDFCWLVRCNPDIQWGEWISSDLGVLFIFHSSCTKYDLAEIF